MSNTRKAKMLINKSGGTASKGSYTYRVTLPTKWVRELNLTHENRDLELSFDGKQIVVKPLKE